VKVAVGGNQTIVGVDGMVGEGVRVWVEGGEGLGGVAERQALKDKSKTDNRKRIISLWRNAWFFSVGLFPEGRGRKRWGLFYELLVDISVTPSRHDWGKPSPRGIGGN
jgi:hypothetical protein